MRRSLIVGQGFRPAAGLLPGVFKLDRLHIPCKVGVFACAFWGAS